MYRFEDIAPVPPFPEGEPGFVEELKQYRRRRPHWRETAAPPSGTLDLRRSWAWEKNFPDPEHLLDSAFAALERFHAAYLPDGGTALKISDNSDPALEPEEYTVEISPEGIRLTSGGIEGIRRAAYFLLDLMRSEAVPALPYGRHHRKPWLKNRISRCFFGPIKRPPFYRDELTDDLDYYPEAYLDMLASEGVNGIWLTVVWKELSKTSFFPEDPLRARRIDKLRRTVEKCRRYGVKVWIFCIEPASWRPENPLPPGGESMQGEPTYEDYHAFCAASEMSRRYIRESSASIFREVPELGGMMLISLGERPTSCLSYVYHSEDGKNSCSGRCGLTNSQILNTVLSAIKDGIRDAGSRGEVLSWLYGPDPRQLPDWWFTLPESLDGDKILAFNFESGCTKSQTGQVHAAGDYWLSAIGPSDRFGRMAAAAKGHCDFAAKMQVGCSHELATVPFIPVPGNLYRKYRKMKSLGVSSVIQCWYFGNYPGLMNRAAGMLAYENFDRGERDFLVALARPEWGPEMAEKVADMWGKFGEAYGNYPLNIQFQYYGPMHDGIVWPLHLKQAMRSMPRSWKPDDFPAGDALGEALVSHSLADVEILTGQLAAEWGAAAAGLPELRKRFADDPDRQRDCDLYEALDLLVHSGADILRFYHLRGELLKGGKWVIEPMKRIVETEIAASERMIALCEADCRLGYHSEAEVYKYFPAKLRWRIGELKKTAASLTELAGESPERIRELLRWEGPVFRTGTEYAAETFRWSAKLEGETLFFTVDLAPLTAPHTLEWGMVMLMDRNGLKFPLVLRLERGGERFPYCDAGQGISVTDCGAGRWQVAVPWGRFDYTKELFVAVQRIWKDENSKLAGDNFPAGQYDFDPRLNFNGFSADRLGLLKLRE